MLDWYITGINHLLDFDSGCNLETQTPNSFEPQEHKPLHFRLSATFVKQGDTLTN